MACKSTKRASTAPKRANAAPARASTAPRAGVVNLARFCENPDNPQTVTAEAFARLVEKVRKIPDGLKANSIAYVSDDPRGKGLNMVISGNKRLRALKAIYGESGIVPAEWFVDVTGMTAQERREFLVNMNVNEGAWEVDKLMEQYSPEELNAAGLSSIVESMGGIESLIEMGDEMGDGEDDGSPSSAGLVTIKLPPELIPSWRSYKKRVGVERIVDFISTELKNEKEGERA